MGTVADIMQEWFGHGACGGWNLMLAYLPDPATEIFEWLVPELQRGGLFHADYEGDGTLRGGLGLQRPGFRSRGRLAVYNKKIERMGKQA